MAAANPTWGAPRIHGELGKLGLMVSERTVSRLLRQPRPRSSQTWRTFLSNHVATLVSMDFFTVPTLTGRVLFVLVLLAHQRRRIVHVNITEHPTAAWTAQQMIEAFPNDTAPRWLLRDRDAIYGDAFRRRVVGMGIGEVLSSKRARKGQRPNPNPGWSSGDPKHPGQLSIRHRPGSCFAFVVDRVSFRQHAFVQDAGNENASRLTSEKHDVLALFHAAQADANVVAGASRRRVVGQPLATGFKLVNVADGLRRAPSAQRILADAQQVGFGIA
jgi:hypothetical protein